MCRRADDLLRRRSCGEACCSALQIRHVWGSCLGHGFQGASPPPVGRRSRAFPEARPAAAAPIIGADFRGGACFEKAPLPKPAPVTRETCQNHSVERQASGPTPAGFRVWVGLVAPVWALLGAPGLKMFQALERPSIAEG